MGGVKHPGVEEKGAGGDNLRANLKVLSLFRLFLVLVVGVGALGVLGGIARAENKDARKHYERATAAFGLGKYADAAVEYESAFRLRPDPALLYNCAQSYRLAGNKTRALELYRNYLRLYSDTPNAENARKQAENLQLELAAERAVAPGPAPVAAAAATPTAPPPTAAAVRPAPRPPLALTPLPSAAGPTFPAPPSSPPVAVAPTPTPTSAPTPATAPSDVHVDVATGPASGGGVAADDGGLRSLFSRPLFWVAVGAVVVATTVA